MNQKVGGARMTLDEVLEAVKKLAERGPDKCRDCGKVPPDRTLSVEPLADVEGLTVEWSYNGKGWCRYSPGDYVLCPKCRA